MLPEHVKGNNFSYSGDSALPSAEFYEFIRTGCDADTRTFRAGSE